MVAPQALILHKDRTAAEAGKEVLSSYGYHCTIAAGYDEALAVVDSLCPALLLLERDPTESTRLQSLLSRESVVAVTTFDTLDAARSGQKIALPDFALAVPAPDSAPVSAPA